MKEQIIAMGSVESPKKTTKQVHTIDEAIEATHIGKYQAILILLSGLCSLGGQIELMNLGIVMPYAKCDLGLSPTEQGLLTSMSFFGIFVTIFFWGYMADVHGRPKVLRICSAGGFLFAILSVFVFNVPLMMALRFLTGTFLAGAQSVSITYIVEFHTSTTAARAAGLVAAFTIMIWVVTPLLSMLIIPMDWVLWVGSFPFRPWRLLLFCCSLINLWNVVVFSLLPETPKFLLATKRKDEALDVLRRMYAFNTGKSKEMYPVTDILYESNVIHAKPANGAWNTIQSIWTQTRPIFQAPLWRNTWKNGYNLFVMLAVGQGSSMWFPDILVQLLNYRGEPTTICNIVGRHRSLSSTSPDVTNNLCDNIDTKDITSFQVLIVISIFYAVVSCLLSFFMTRIKVIVVVWLLLTSAVSIALITQKGFVVIVLGYIVLASVVFCFGLQTAYAATLYPTSCRAAATSFLVMCGRLGSAFGGIMIGWLLSNGCDGMFYMFAVTLATCIVLSVCVKDSRNESNGLNGQQ